MGSLYLSSIMKVQTISFFLVAICLCISHISAKNIPESNEVEIEKYQAEAVLKRNARGLFGGDEEEENNKSDEDYYDYGNEENQSNRENNNNRGNGNGNGNGSGRGKNVDWVKLIMGIFNLIKNAGVF